MDIRGSSDQYIKPVLNETKSIILVCSQVPGSEK
jgi:hypothetical protein